MGSSAEEHVEYAAGPFARFLLVLFIGVVFGSWCQSYGSGLFAQKPDTCTSTKPRKTITPIAETPTRPGPTRPGKAGRRLRMVAENGGVVPVAQ